MRHYLSNVRMNIYAKKQIVYQANKLVATLFISIRFEINWIVHDRPDIAVTSLLVVFTKCLPTLSLYYLNFNANF